MLSPSTRMKLLANGLSTRRKDRVGWVPSLVCVVCMTGVLVWIGWELVK